MSPVAIREDEMGATAFCHAQSLRRRLGRHTDVAGHAAPQALEDPQHLVEVGDPVDVELRRGLRLGGLAAPPTARRRRSRPARSTAMVFSATPPDVTDVAVLVDGAGRRHDAVAGEACPLLSLSMMPSVMASPAEGPPMSWVCTVTLTGKCQSCWVWGTTPR